MGFDASSTRSASQFGAPRQGHLVRGLLGSIGNDEVGLAALLLRLRLRLRGGGRRLGAGGCGAVVVAVVSVVSGGRGRGRFRKLPSSGSRRGRSAFPRRASCFPGGRAVGRVAGEPTTTIGAPLSTTRGRARVAGLRPCWRRSRARSPRRSRRSRRPGECPWRRRRPAGERRAPRGSPAVSSRLGRRRCGLWLPLPAATVAWRCRGAR